MFLSVSMSNAAKFDADELLEALDAHARNEGVVARLDRAAMITALVEAKKLAGGRPENEPAALFYAFGRRSAKFGPAARFFVPSLVHAQPSRTATSSTSATSSS
jgi:hypothetical protein